MEGMFDGVTRDLATLAVALLLIGAAVGAGIHAGWTRHQQHGASCKKRFGAARTAGDTLSMIRVGCDFPKTAEQEVGRE